MSIDYYFPTAIYSEKLILLSHELLPIVNQYLNNNKMLTNHWGYKTTFKVDHGLENFQNIEIFNQLIQEKGRLFLNNLGYNTDGLNFTLQIFASNMTVNDYHAVHSHPNSLLSGIFYLDVEESSSPIIFHDPRPFRKFVALPRKNETTASYEKIAYVPENGLLLIWESWLEHEVPKNNSKNRITLVFNLGRK
jgi:uncharacterized protein (TIGR02466 family)